MNRIQRLLTLLFLTCGLTTGLWASSIPGALSGRFTINASGEKVVFSQGNLQYVGTWQFAENQWDCFSTSQYNDHRDLFGWGTGDAPNKVSTNNGDYGTFTDWGTNAITNGGNTENSGWRTLTIDEWVYLFYSRVNASTLFGFGSVAGVNGLIILPDNWITPEGASFTASTTLGLTNHGSYYYNGNNDNYSHNTYTAEQWAVMESAGAVFLPAAAYRHGVDSNIQYTYQGGFYWSSTPYDSDKAYYLNFYYHSLDPQFKEMRYGGRPVRLVKASLDQDNEGYYLLSSAQDWKLFAALVQTTPTANAKMTADIDLGDDQTILGTTTDLAYKGTFDGQGHTLTVNISSSVESFAPFRYVGDGAAIQNLRIAGTVNGSNRRVGGFVGEGYGTYSISNCISSVTLNTTYNGDGIQGGFVASQRGTCQVTDCIFDGVFYGPNAYTWGGIVGWNYGSTSISNCLVLCDSYNVSNTDVATFIPNSNNITNCYYKTAIGTAQGTQATTAELADGTTAYKLQNNRGDLVWGQRIGTDAEPVLTNDENYRVYRSKTGGYTNNPEEAYEGIQQDGEGNYLLGSLPDWQVFAEIVNSGTNAAANAKMTADIDLGDDQTHIGSVTEGATPYYAGIFDGQGHTLTVNYVGESDQIVAPFTQISSATIKNLHVAGSIQSSYAYIGVVGMAGSGSVISKVWMSATMNTTQDGWVQSAAIAGYCNGSIQDCLFTGTYTSNGGGYMGGFYGYTNASPTITNCLSTGTFSQGNWQGNGVHTNCYLKQYPTGLTEGCSWATDETLSNGTIATALQADRAEEVWVQDPLTNQPMLKLFAGKYTVPASGLGTFSAKAKFALPEGLEAYYCKDYDTSEGTIGVVAINGVVPAETGVLLRGEPGETYTLTISDETAATVTDNALVAVTEQTTIQQTDGDYTNFGLSGGTFKKVNTNGGTVKANRAYLHIPTSALTPEASARGILLAWDGEPTGVESIHNSECIIHNPDGAYYTLDGRRLQAEPAKGLYIVNGKKVIIK